MEDFKRDFFDYLDSHIFELFNLYSRYFCVMELEKDDGYPVEFFGGFVLDTISEHIPD